MVPFFPTDWKKNANDVFNHILNGEVPTEDAYDDVTHAAIHRKGAGGADTSPFLAAKAPEETITGDRPTSGKHFAREHQFAKRKGELKPPNADPIQSAVAKNYETSKKVEGLLNRLAGYMAGEIPDNDDLTDLFGKDKNADDDASGNQPFDDATTNYTKDDPLIPLQLDSGPRVIEAEDEEVPDGDDDGDGGYGDGLDDGDIELDPDNLQLPDIYGLHGDGYKKPKRRPDSRFRKKEKPENLFIYKDFDTTLTKVKGPLKCLPKLDQTTRIRGEDLIRDRLLSFKVKDGNLEMLNPRDKRAPLTMIERSELLKRKKLAESAA